MAPEDRWAALKWLRGYYSDFRDFYRDCSVELLSFEPTDMQFDIANFLQTGPRFSMIQAQRGEAKTTITGCFAVWCLIHNPQENILIISAGGKMSAQVANWVISIINGMPTLECMVPDKSHTTTRTSVEMYDVHHVLKGTNKSPSVCTLGVTSNMQGYRATLLIADDVESSKNAYTDTMREQLREKTRDFTSINRKGKIVYLGTPQTTDSIYIGLPSRGYTVRIWPGRFPTHEEEKNYGSHLAPFVLSQMQKDPALREGGGVIGDRGKPTDPEMMPEEELCNKELDQGPAYFMLQYMLDTAMSDKNRFPLKSENLIVYPLDSDEAPSKFSWGMLPQMRVDTPPGWPEKVPLYHPVNVSKERMQYTQRILALDPAGESKKENDETGYAVMFIAGGWYFLMDCGGIDGATRDEGKARIAELITKWDVKQVVCEKNHGGGMFTNFVRGIVNEHNLRCGVEEVWSSGQKELRIIDALDPIISSHRMIVNQSVVVSDHATVQGYPADLRNIYQMFWQLTKITRDRNALRHDDRLEAVAIAARYCADIVALDSQKEALADHNSRWGNFIKNPTGMPVGQNPAFGFGTMNAMQKYGRR